MVSISSDANLGATNVVAVGTATYAVNQAGANQTHGAASATDFRLRGGVLQVTGNVTTGRSLIFGVAGGGSGASSSGIDVSAGSTFALTTPTLNQTTVPTSVTLTKTGAGTLAFNSAGTLNDTITVLNIGGAPLIGADSLLSGTGGGTVSTTATGGLPFSTGAVNIFGGTLGLVGGGLAQALTVTTVNFGGGSHISLNPGATTTQLTATALNRSGQGTLVIQPLTATLGDFGAGANAAKLLTSSTETLSNGMLATPSIVVQDPVSGAYNYVTYGAGNGFTVYTGATVNSLGASAATSLADLSGAPVQVGTGIIDVMAVRTSADITPTDGTSLLRIDNGGLIINAGATSPTISSNVFFGTAPASPAEAFVYVSGGPAATSVLNGNFTAANFTKSGNGTLVIGGNANVMAPVVSNLRAFAVNEGTVKFNGQGSLPSGGQITLAPMDTGTVDLNGTSLTIGGLAGSPLALAAFGTTSGSSTVTVTSTAGMSVGMVVNGPNIPAGALVTAISSGTAFTISTTATATASAGLGNALTNPTGNILSSSAATLTLATTNQSNQFNGLISGNVTLNFQGTGQVALGYNNTYTGTTTIGVGSISSANGLFTPNGTLQANSFLSLGNNSTVTLAGGNLTVADPIAGSEVEDNFLINSFGPGNGYNLVLAANASIGIGGITSSAPNTTSTITYTGNAAWQAISSLTINAANFNTAGAAATGLFVRGATTLAGNTTFNIGGSTATSGVVLGGQVSGGDITKIGAATLFLTNTDPGAGANAVTGWHVMQGTLEARGTQGTASNPLGDGVTVQLDGGTLNLRDDGDGLADAQIISTYATNNILVGSTALASSANFIGSANSTLNVAALVTAEASNKTIQVGTLQFGGALNGGQLTITGANTFGVEFTGGVQLLGRDGILSQGTGGATVTIDGTISGNGTFIHQLNFQTDLYINTNATGNTTGGTILASNNDTYFGSFTGGVKTLNDTSKLGGGNISVQRDSRILLSAATNLNAGQYIDLRSNLNAFAVIGIAGDGDNALIGSNVSFASYNFRSPFAGGQFVNSYVAAPNVGSGILAINSVYSQAIDLGHIGDGTWFLGSSTNGTGLNGTYVGSTALTAGVSYNGTGNINPTYRLGGGTGILYIGVAPGDASSVPNQLTGTTNLVVGAPLTNGSGGTILRGTGTVVLNTAQNYTGSTIVNAGSSLQFRGQVATSGFDVFGNNNAASGSISLTAAGSGGRFLAADGNTAIPVTFHAGSMVLLDNSVDLLPATANFNQGRWSDTASFNIDGSVFKLEGSPITPITEQVGAATVFGESIITSMQAPSAPVLLPTTFSFANIVEGVNRAGTGDNGTVSIEPTVAGQLGITERVVVSVPANLPAVNNGMVAAWMWDQRDNSWLTYGATGFATVADSVTITSNAAPVALTAASATPNDRLLLSGTGTSTTTANSFTLASGVTVGIYALHITGNTTAPTNITLTTATDNTAKFVIGSGGIITGNTNSTIAPGLTFGTSGTAQADFHVGTTTTNTLTIGDNTQPNTSGQITASNIVKDGPGILTLDAEQQAYAGPIALNAGTLTLNNRTSGNTGASNAGGKGGTIFINGYNSTLNLASGAAGSFNSSVYIAAGDPLFTIGVNRLTGAATSQTILGGVGTGAIAGTGNLTFGGSAGDQGQTLIVNNLAGTTAQQLRINGSTFLPSTANASSNVTFVTNTDTFLTGLVGPTGGVQAANSVINLVKQGGSNLWLDTQTSTTVAGQSSTFSGGIIVENGGLVSPGFAPAPVSAASNITVNPLGANNTVTMVGGTLFLRGDDDNTTTFSTITYNTNDVVVNGNSTINADRTGAQAAETAKLLQFRNLTIGAETLTVSAGNSYRLGVSGTTTLLASPTLNLTNDLVFNGPVTDNGGGLSVIKQGGGSLWFNNSASTFTGPLYVEAGILRFGNGGTTSTTATVGNASSIVLDPGAAIQLQATTNINTGIGQKIDARSGNFAGGFDTVQMNAAMNPASLITSTSSGLLVGAVAMSTALDMSTIGNGTFQLATTTQLQYTATTLGAGAPSANIPGVGVYRLGGNGQNLFFNANALFLGNTRVQIGSLESPGGQVWIGNGNNTAPVANTYTGGTTVARGTTARVDTSAVLTVAADNFGSGTIDLFGALQVAGLASLKLNTVNLHPGATVRLSDDSSAHSNDRWDDNTPMALFGSNLDLGTFVGNTSSETIGNLSFAAGSRVDFINAGAGLINVGAGSGTLTRVGNATLVFTTAGANQLGATAVGGSGRLIVNGTAPTVVNGMVGAYIVNQTDNSFVTYGANGFANAAATQTNLPAGLTAGTAIVNVNANTQLVDNPVIYAMSISAAATISNAIGQLNTITLDGAGASGANIGGIIASNNAITIAANIKAGSNGQFELPIFVNGNTTTITGDISANGITKFGVGTLTITKDQSDAARGTGNGLSGGWVVNEGVLNVGAFGALGNAVATNTVTLNGAASSSAQLTLAVNSGNATNSTYTSGRIIAVDNAVINIDQGADDRTQTISDVQVQSTGGALLDAQLKFNYTTARNRSLLDTGVLSLVDAPGSLNNGQTGGAIINVAWGTALTGATSTGVSVAALSGSDRLRKWGAGTLYVRGDSTIANTGSDGSGYNPYIGNISIEQGAIQIENVNALGTGTVTVNRFGVLDINAQGYTGGAAGGQSVTYLPGAVERWSADGARTGGVTLNLGATDLQIANDQTGGVATIQLNGGTIEGYLNRDSDIATTLGAQGAVYRTIGSGYTFQLQGGSFVGQNLTAGVNGDDSGVTANVFTPLSASLQGVVLEIKGQITGVGSLTKQGTDTVVISNPGSSATPNDYSGGTFVTQGWLRAGADNALPITGTLTTTGGGVFDVNGYNVEVGTLTSAGLTVSGAAANGNGYITNTAPYVSSLTVGNGTSADFTYAGILQANLGLVKTGSNVLILTNTNTNAGPTTISQGVIRAVDGVGLSANSNLVIHGDTINAAIYEPTTATFTRPLGTGAGQVQLPGGISGFEAFGTPLTVDLGGVGAPITWGSNQFNPLNFVLNDTRANAPITFANTLNLNASVEPVTRTIAVNNASNAATLTGNLTQGPTAGPASIDKVGVGTLILGGTVTTSYTGSTIVDNGTLQLGAANQLPSVTLVTVNNTTGTGTLDLHGFSQTVGNISGTGANAVITSNTGPATLTAGDTSNQTYAGTIVDGTGSGVVTLIKQGTGSLTLSGISTYSGQTTVNAGTLLLNGQLNGVGGGITVNNVGTIFGGTGSTTRLATINAGAIIDAGATPGSAIGTFTLGGLTLTDPSTQVDVQLNSDGSSVDLINAGSLIINGGVVDVALLGGATATAGTYHILDYTSLGGSGSLTIGTPVVGSNHLHASIVVNAGNNSIDLVLAPAGQRFWTGATNGNWNLSTPGNWTPVNYANGDDAIFNDSASTFNVVLDNVDGPLTPNSVTFNNNSNNYTLSGPGTITGAAPVTMNGTAMVTISNANSYSGATQINAGVISVNAANNIGDGSATNSLGLAGGGVLQSTGTFDLGALRTVTLGSGGGGLDVTGSNVLTVSGKVTGGDPADNLTINPTVTSTGTVLLTNTTNDYGTATVVAHGTLQLGNDGVIPSTSNLTINGPGTLDMNGKSNAVAGFSGSGTVTNTAPTTASTLTVGTNNITASFSGGIQDGVGTVAFTKVGTGTQTLSGSSTFSGATTVSGGTLVVSGSISGTANVDVKSGATLAGSGSITTGTSAGVVLEAGSFLAPTAASTLTLSVAGNGKVDISAAVGATNSQSLLFTLDPLNTNTSSQVAVTNGSVGATNALEIGTGVLEFDDFQFTFANPVQSNPNGQTYVLFASNGPITESLGANVNGSFNGVPANIAISGNDIILQVVPEPNSLSMLAGSVGLALGLQRFRRRRRSA
jgi:autotransporter-associated beta strand protein